MEIDELLQRIDKARLHALAEHKRLITEADKMGPDDLTAVAYQISAAADLSVVRALDTILGLDTPPPLADNSPGQS